MAKSKLLFLPLPVPGHLSPTLQAAKALLQATNNKFTITVLLPKLPAAPEEPSAMAAVRSLASSGLDIHFQDLPAVEPPSDADFPEEFITLFFEKYKPHLRSAIAGSPVPVAALIVDTVETAVIDAATELGVPTYVHFTSTALLLGLMLYLPTLDQEVGGDKEFEDIEGGILLPGVAALQADSLPYVLLSRKRGNYAAMVCHGKRLREVRGIIINTCQELEPLPLKLLAEGRFTPGCSSPAVYPIGPLLDDDAAAAPPQGGERHQCLEWLDQQPAGSVVFLCFGSMGAFGVEQLKEIAEGLEGSSHRFLWVVRSHGADITKVHDANLAELLPSGFLERTREKGMVWESWAPQAAILSHEAVGGFVTHSGWNSCLESLWFGVPTLVWPLFSEQHLNAVEMRDLGFAVGLEVDRKKGNYVGAEELERGMRCLMGGSEEGERVRAKVKEMRVACRRAIETGGSSYNYLQELAKELGA